MSCAESTARRRTRLFLARQEGLHSSTTHTHTHTLALIKLSNNFFYRRTKSIVATMATAISLFLILFVAFFGASNAAFSFPDPNEKDHGFKVAVAHFPLVDTVNKDFYKPNEQRRIMASVFLPVPKAVCSKECTTPYMPSDTARICGEQFLVDKPTSVFEQLSYSTCCENSGAFDVAKFPVVVLDSHVDTSRLMYTNLARYISANGVIVILLDHPGDTSIVEFTNSTETNGTIYNSGTIQLSNYSPLTDWNETITTAGSARNNDRVLALNKLAEPDALASKFPSLHFSSKLNTSRYGIIGHGFGGMIATLAGFHDSSIAFSINLSGTGFPMNVTAPSCPIYFLGRANYRRDDDRFWPNLWSKITTAITEADVADSEIFDFSDLPIVAELAQNEEGRKDVKARGVGSSGATANHAMTCWVEAIVKKEMLGNPAPLSDCIRSFPGLVPYQGNKQVMVRASRKASMGVKGRALGAAMGISVVAIAVVAIL